MTSSPLSVPKSSGESDKPFSPATAAAAIAREAGAIPFTVWTHHPSDTRITHGRWALDLTAAVGGPVRHTLPAGEPVVLDPVEVAASPYEQERLDATVEWVRRHLDPIAGRVIEVGAHEGALTRRLVADGYSVDATEPNERFLDATAVERHRRRTHPSTQLRGSRHHGPADGVGVPADRGSVLRPGPESARSVPDRPPVRRDGSRRAGPAGLGRPPGRSRKRSNSSRRGSRSSPAPC